VGGAGDVASHHCARPWQRATMSRFVWLFFVPVVVVLATAAAEADASAATRGGDPLHVASTRFTLDNGMPVVLIEDHSVPRVHVGLRVRTGSSSEQPGRTGFAHLFEHLMFEGSQNVPEGKFDEWLEAAGGENNAWTSEDFTYYYEEVPSNALELALFLESDRQGFFVDTLVPDLVEGQRDVVKNERRQTGENRPYGKAELATPALLWPPGHPYSWPVIGSMDDLTAASIDDVRAFFLTQYAPANASLVIVGDFQTGVAKALVEKWFADVKPRAAPPPPGPSLVRLPAERRAVFEDDVELPRVSLIWPSDRLFGPDDAKLDLLAGVLADGESSRLVKRLVHDLRLAQSVAAHQESRVRAGEFVIEVLAFPGTNLADVVRFVDDELGRLLREGPTDDELARAQTAVEAHLLDELDALASLAERASAYAMLQGDPDGMGADLQRYRSVTKADIVDAGRRTLTPGRLIVSVVPDGQLGLSVRSPVSPAASPQPGGAR
jgi:zinc protease